MIRVMILDDEAPARIAIRALGDWEKYGITEFDEAETAEEALVRLRRAPAQLVFVDMQMPGMNGTDFMEHASRDFPDTRFIVVSGYDYFSYAKAALKCGAVDYVLKPIPRDELNAAIDKAMAALSAVGEPEVTAEEGKPSPEEVIRRIHRDIKENYAQPLKVSQYAQQYFFTKEYLSRLFHQKYGLSIQELLLRVRMEEAAALLRDPGLKIQDIALRVGYPDNNYFSKAFRGYYGVSPKEYRGR